MATLNQTIATTTDNPYVGPRTFSIEEGHLFFGREREARALIALIIAERLVLFYSQSGAGKSSLMNARLIPGLAQEGFEILPVGRVSGVETEETAVENIFVFNLIASLHQGPTLPAGSETMSLCHFLDNLAFKDGRFLYDDNYTYTDGEEIKPRVLLIDQFEEILTTNTAYWQHRDGFFQQLRTAFLQDEQLWVVFSMREDFVAGLDLFLDYLPNNLRNRYYMQRLDRDAALEAITRPARQAGRPFTKGAAELLVDNLRKLRLTGKQEAPRLDQYVEPVQLQAVCYQMWERLKSDPAGEISCDHVLAFGDVDAALINFYEETIADTIAQTGVSEVSLRNWFDTALITEMGTRNMVFRGLETTGDIPTAVADHVRDRFILREINRPGGVWYELVHDRFVQPIQDSNRAWRLEQPLPRLAQQWEDAGRSKELLLGYRELKRLSDTNYKALGPLVTEFVNASQAARQKREDARASERQAAQQREMEQQRALAETQRQRAEEAEVSRRRQRKLTKLASVVGAVAIVAAAIATILGFLAFDASTNADEQREIAETKEAETNNALAVTQLSLDAAEVARSEANSARAEALESLELAKNAQKEAESLRMADKVESLLIEGNIIGALLVSHIAVDITPTNKAMVVLSQILSLAVDTSSEPVNSKQGNVSEMLELACSLAGRNLTADEWDEKFSEEPFEETYLETCDAFGLHISFAEQSLRTCTGLDEARGFYAQATPPTEADGNPTTFDDWALPILLNEAIKTNISKRNCLNLTQLEDEDAETFLDIVNRVHTLETQFDPTEIFDELKQLNHRRNDLPPPVIAALDELFTENFGRLCVNLHLSFENAESACQSYNNLAQSRGLIPITPITETHASRTFTISASKGKVASIEVSENVTLEFQSPDNTIPPSSFIMQETDMTYLYNFLIVDNGDFTFDVEWNSAEPPDLFLSIELIEPMPLSYEQEIAKATNDQQWWQFEGERGDIASISMNKLDGGDPVLRLFNDSGEFIAENDDGGEGLNALLEVILPDDEIYFISANWYDNIPGEYQLLLDQVEGEIEYGQTKDVTNSQRFWQFNGSQGDVVAITIITNDESDLWLRLLNEEGNEIGFNDNDPTGSDFMIDAILPTNGVYYINISGDAGRYSLSLMESEVGMVNVGDTIPEADADKRWWQFEGQQGDFVTIAMNALEDSGDPYLKLLDEQNNTIVMNDNSSESKDSLIHWKLPVDGIYYIDAGWYSNPGQYSLSVERFEPDIIDVGETTEANAEVGWWQFEGHLGDIVAIAMDATDYGDPVLQLIDINGNHMSSNDDTEESLNSLIHFSLPEDGIYYINAGWYSNPGRYTLSLTTISRENDPSAAATALKEGALYAVRQGLVEEGLAFFEEAQSLDDALTISAENYNTICWFGALWKFAVQVFPACEEAVALEPEHGGIADSRGVARAMTGDFEGAIEDFQFFIEWNGFGPESDLRQQWIEELEAGRNPFEDESLLEQLRNG